MVPMRLVPAIPASLDWDYQHWPEQEPIIGLLLAVTVGSEDQRGDLGLLVDDRGRVVWHPLDRILAHLPPEMRLPVGWARKAPAGAPEYRAG